MAKNLAPSGALTGLFFLVLLFARLLSSSSQSLTGYSSQSNVPMTLDGTSSYSSNVILSLAVPTTAFTDSVLLIVNLNLLATADDQSAAFTIYRDAVDLAPSSTVMVNIDPTEDDESQSATFSFMDQPGSVGTFTYTVRGKYNGIVSSSSQIRQLAAIVSPTSYSPKLLTLSSEQEISSTSYADIGLQQTITTTATLDRVLVSAFFSLYPEEDDSAAAVSLYRNNVQVGSDDLQLVNMVNDGDSRLLTFLYLDSPGITGAVTYSVRPALYSSGSGDFKVSNSNADIAHVTLLGVSSSNSNSSSATGVITVSSTTFVTLGLSVTITPPSVTSKVLITVNINFRSGDDDTQGAFTIFRGSTNLGDSNVGLQVIKLTSSSVNVPATLTFLDTPGTTNSVTYTVQAKNLQSGENFKVSFNGQVRQIAVIALATGTIAPTAAPVSSPSQAPTLAVVDCSVLCSYPTVVNIVAGAVVQRVTLASAYALTFSLTVPLTVTGTPNVLNLVSVSSGSSLISVYRSSQTTLHWYYNGISVVDGWPLISASVGGTVTRTTYTVSVMGNSLTIFSNTQSITLSYTVVGVSTSGNVYDLYASGAGIDSSAGTIGEIVIKLGGVGSPTVAPTAPIPSVAPTHSTVLPTCTPTTHVPTVIPTTSLPSVQPSLHPVADPSLAPTAAPTTAPVVLPTKAPVSHPTLAPTAVPTTAPVVEPSTAPSDLPTKAPVAEPTLTPTATPTLLRSFDPSPAPSESPVVTSTVAPSANPTTNPTVDLTAVPSFGVPSTKPTDSPSFEPTEAPTAAPTSDSTTIMSSAKPTVVPTSDNPVPTEGPTAASSTTTPTVGSTQVPTQSPSKVPSVAPTVTTAKPSVSPSAAPLADPTAGPSVAPSATPTVRATAAPSAAPTVKPSTVPTVMPSATPSIKPSTRPTASPTVQATDAAGVVVPTVPQLASATFSNDGSYFVVAFTAATNQAGLSSSFVCSKVLTFDGLSTATCAWSDSSTITVYPGSSQLSLDSSVALIAANGVKAACPSTVATTVCAAWSHATAVSVTIVAPSVPTAPVVSLVFPNLLSGCIPLSVDLSSSSGSGGRAWKAPVFTVTQGEGSAVAAFLNKNYTFSGPISVPSSLFPVNGVYTISVRLTNFLGASGTATNAVTVNLDGAIYPTVLIPGQNVRTVSSNAALLLTTSAYTADCSGVQSTSNLAYAWTVTVNGLVQTSLVSQSADASKFRLAAYSLTPLTTYAILVTVTNSVSRKSSTASISVYVQRGSLVSQVSGGNTQAVSIGSSLTLDASSSYDQDMATLTGVAVGLSFAWTCTQTAPSVSSTCPLTVTGASLPAVDVSADGTAASTTALLTVTVTKGTRNSTATVLVTAQDSSAPQVAITSTAASVTSVNVNNRLTLAASVTVQSSCTALWSVDAATVSLASSALSALSTVIPVGSTRALNLVLAAAALPERSSLVFTLACGQSSAAITVTTNGPPVPGLFAVTPSSGVELSTSFAFSASLWSDTDLPITYQFGFVSPSSGSTLTVRARSESSSGASTLPAGSSTASNVVTCNVVVYDVLNSAASTSSVVTVTPQTDSTLLQASLVAQLTASAGNNDAMKSAISIGSTVINAVTCSAAPACASLNRAGCAKVQNTCGACLSGYLGDSGDRNSQCVSATSTGTGKTVDSPCSSNAECGGWLACTLALSAPVCYLPAKRCTDDCSGHGTCVAQNANSMKQVASCYSGDSTCVVSCDCVATFSGTNCNTTEATISQQQSLRLQYLQSLSTVSTSDDIDSDSVAALSSSLSSLTQNSYELSAASVDLINQVATTVLTNAATLEDFTYDQAVGVLSAINAAATATVRLNSTNTVAFANQMMDSIALFNTLVSSQLVAGQDAVDYIQDSFRVSSIRQLRGFNSSIKIASPTTLLEQSNGGRTSSVSVGADSTSGSRLLSVDVDENEEFAVSMVVTAASSYGDLGNSFNSNPVQVTVLRTASTPTRVTFVLAHNEAGDFTTREEAASMGFNSTCTGRLDDSLYYYTCPLSGDVLTHNCTGLSGVMTSYCPVRGPTCAIVNGTAGAVATNSSDCEVLSFDLYSTTCSCLIQPSSQTVRNRRLSLSELEQTGLLDAVSVTVYIGSEFKDTFNSAGQLDSVAALQRVLIVIIMFCTLWAGGLLLIFSCTWRRNAMKKLNAQAETHLEKKVQVAEVSRSPAAVQQYLADYVIQTFPSVFSNKPFFSRLYGEVKRHHRYLTLFTAPEGESGDKQRILTGVQLLTIQTMLMFLLAMLYDVQSPSDDGTCGTFTTADTCIARKSVFDTTTSYCDWKEVNAQNQTYACEYRNPVFSLKVTLYISVIVAIMTAIISYPSDYIFELLSAPVADEAKAAAQESTIKKLGRRASNVARRASNAALTVATAAKAKVSRNSYVEGTVTVKLPGATEAAHALATASMTVIAENSRRTIMNRQMTRMRSYQASGGKYGVLSAGEVSSSDSDDSDNSDDDSDNNLGAEGDEIRDGEATQSSKKAGGATAAKATDETTALLSKLSEEVHCQRRLLKPSEVEEFDTQWGLDPTGEFTQGERSVVPCLSGRPGAEQTLLRELKYVKKEAHETAEKLSIATDAHTGLEILHLFIKDLLGRDTPAAIIFETKSEEDFQHTEVVTRNKKRLAALALAGINGFFVYYSILTGFRKGVHWQQIFLAACIVQFIVEVLLFETMECVWINCAIPVLVSDEVRRVGDSIIEVVQQLCSETPAESRLFLNAPDYLFVSTNVAKQYPHLMESILVQAYNSHIPGELARKWQTGSIARMHRRHRRRNVTVLGMFFRVLQYVGTMPFLIHRMVIRFIQPFVLTGLALLWQIIVSNVIYIAVAVFVLLVILTYGLYRRHLENEQFQKNQNVTPVFAQYLSSKTDPGGVDDEGSDEDFHKPNAVAIISAETRGSATESKNGSDEAESDGFDSELVDRAVGSNAPHRRPSVSESELSSTDLSTVHPVRRAARASKAAAVPDSSSESEFSAAVERRHRPRAGGVDGAQSDGKSSVSDESLISSDGEDL